MGFAQPVELFEKSGFPAFENPEGMACGTNWQCPAGVAEALWLPWRSLSSLLPRFIPVTSLIYVRCLAYGFFRHLRS